MKFRDLIGKEITNEENVITIDFEGQPRKVNLVDDKGPSGVAVVKFISDADIEKYGKDGVEIKGMKKIEDGK